MSVQSTNGSTGPGRSAASAAGQAPMDAQAQLKPSSPPHSPPPAYASLAPAADPYAPQRQHPGGRPGSAASTSSSQTIHAPVPPSFPSNNALYTPIPSQPPNATHPHAFGPTPLPLALPYGGLPYAYYEPAAAADSRARRRFMGAFVVGFGIYFLFISALGLEIYGEMA